MDEDRRVSILESIDRELSFFRRRAGAVFFLAVTVEVLILAGREKVVVPTTWPWFQPFVYGILFIAVALAGILLGSEYRARIHVLKQAREDTLHHLKPKGSYPPIGGLVLSEIEMLYVVLVFLSSCGVILVWLNALPTYEDGSWMFRQVPSVFWFLFAFFLLVGLCGIAWASMKVIGWLWLMWRRRRACGEEPRGGTVDATA